MKDNVKKRLIFEYLDACTIACSHCVSSSAPGLKDILPVETAKSAMTAAKRNGYFDVNITGGEPFLVFEILRELVRHAKAEGQMISVTSNAFWASSVKAAADKLSLLKEDGLTKIHLSYDRPHFDQGIPLENLESGVLAARKIGLEIAVWLTCMKEDAFSMTVKDRMAKYGTEFRVNDVVPLGRGASLEKSILPEYKSKDLSRGCNTYSFLVIDPRGECYACCNAAAGAAKANPLRLGNIHKTPLETILGKKQRLAIHELISFFGPKALYDALPAELRQGLDLKTHPCAFCLEMLNSNERASYLAGKIDGGDKDFNRKLQVARMLRETEALTEAAER